MHEQGLAAEAQQICDAMARRARRARRKNEPAVSEMGTGVLTGIARDLVKSLRDISTSWVSRDDVRAKIRSTIKRLLAKYGSPPDAQPTATELVLHQVETFAEEWALSTD